MYLNKMNEYGIFLEQCKEKKWLLGDGFGKSSPMTKIVYNLVLGYGVVPTNYS